VLVLGAIMLLLSGFVASRSERLAAEAREAGRPGRFNELAGKQSTWLAIAAVVFVIGALNVIAAS
jgi:hypothetical protein